MTGHHDKDLHVLVRCRNGKGQKKEKDMKSTGERLSGVFISVLDIFEGKACFRHLFLQVSMGADARIYVCGRINIDICTCTFMPVHTHNLVLHVR